MELLTYCFRTPFKSNACTLFEKKQPSAIKRIASTLFERWRSSWLSLFSYLSVVGGISFYDIYLTIKYAESLQQHEANPVGRWLMGLDHLARTEIPDVTLFIGCKTIGTLLVLSVLAILVMRWARFGHPIAMGVSLFQISLGYFLTFSLTTSFK